MAGSGKFTFTFSERELSLLADAAEVCARFDTVVGTVFTRAEFQDMAHRLDERMHW